MEVNQTLSNWLHHVTPLATFDVSMRRWIPNEDASEANPSALAILY